MKENKLLTVFFVFLKMGFFSFGGPAAHIAMMETEIVNKRKWISKQHFLDLIGATNLIPGPNSTEMTMHCGHEYAGKPGLILAGLAFITPAIFLTTLIAWFYAKYGQIPAVEKWTYGIQSSVLAIILHASFTLGQKAVKNLYLLLIGIIVLILSLSGFSEIILLFFGGFIGLIILYIAAKNQKLNHSFFPILLFIQPLYDLLQHKSVQLFLSFLKIGFILYGGGMVLFAYLDESFVQNGLLSKKILIDAIAVGQFTPGPILSSASFVGFQMQGFSGAILASLGIFLPSFLMVWLLNPLIPKMRNSKLFSYFLDSVNVAAIALIFAIFIDMSFSTLVNWKNITLFSMALGLLFRFKNIHAMYIVLLGSLGGYILYFI